MLLERGEDRGNAPNKHPCIPHIVTRLKVSLRQLQRGLLNKPPDVEKRSSLDAFPRFALLNVAETRGRLMGLDANGHKDVGRLRRFKRRIQITKIGGAIVNHVVRRQHGKDTVRVARLNQDGSQYDGRSRVPTHRLDHHVSRWQ